VTALARIGHAMRRCIDNDRAAALIEFAFALPVIMLLFVGGVQLDDAISCRRKVTITTRTIADLVSQNTTGSTSANEIASSLNASTEVMAPYAAGNALVRISEFTTAIDPHTLLPATTIVWSRAINGSALAANSTITVPADFGLVGPLSLKDHIYMVPRNTSSISCSDC
jgi:Flp pilus assembly protein TadG